MASICNRGLGLLDWTGLIIFWFTFNRQVHTGISDGNIISKKLIRVLWLGRVNGCLLWDTNVDEGHAQFWI